MNRGVALLGDRVFYFTDDAHLLALNRLTGTLLWDVYTPEDTQRYGGTSAPLSGRRSGHHRGERGG